MKKLSIFFSLAIALGLASCDNYVEPNPAPQSNPQEAIMSADGLTVALGDDLSTGAVDLKAAADAAKNISVVKTVACENLPQGASVEYKMQLSATEDFAKTEELDVTDGAVNPQAWEDAHLALFGKSPKAKDTYYRFAAYAVDGTESFRIGGEERFYAAGKASVTPFPSDVVLEDNYYLLGTINGWSVAKAIKFNHSEASVYDDPVFTLAIEISANEAANGWWWKIVPESTFQAGDWVDANYSQYGPFDNGDEATDGYLFPKIVDPEDMAFEPGAGCLKVSGPFLLTINMEELTYRFEQTYDVLYTPGDANGWNHANSNLLYTDDYANYRGYIQANPNGFKFATDMSWDNDHTYGMAGESGTLTKPGSDIKDATVAGVYYCDVNIPSLTYKITHIASIGLIGAALPQAWDTDSYSVATEAGKMVYTFNNVTFKEGEWKFRMNGAWDISLGAGSNGRQLDQSNDNLQAPSAGTYNVTLDLSAIPYTYTLSRVMN
ncbi:MAG: DUF5115 domain-containing protein [Muribaculaceae bacterium]|nr:DUF5115 domain-containing protein [Muribaculaceae bacterium]